MLHGHGLRSRDLWGPQSPGAPPTISDLQQRRYQCQRCRAVITVRPAGILPRFLYTAMAIALALVLWSHARLAAHAVRARVSPHRTVGATAAPRWASLPRWTRSPRRLWRGIGAWPSTAGPREIAHRVSAQLAARARIPSGALIADAFAGAAHAD
jgi:hypothetical protein